MSQTSIKKQISCSGIGLHNGELVQMVLHPAPENTGIVFHVHTGRGVKRIYPNPDDVIATGLCTTLKNSEASVSTVEHLLATVRSLRIDNIIIEIKGGEVPIMDGSAASFLLLLKNAGIQKQKSARTVAKIIRPFEFKKEGKWIKAYNFGNCSCGFLCLYAGVCQQ